MYQQIVHWIARHKVLATAVGAVGLFALLNSKSASADNAPAPSTSGGNTGAGFSGNPAPGDVLQVHTLDQGALGQLNIRSNPGADNPSLTTVKHGDIVTATGQAQQSSDGSTWLQVSTLGGTTGWAASQYLVDTTQSGIASNHGVVA